MGASAILSVGENSPGSVDVSGDVRDRGLAGAQDVVDADSTRPI
jgi:hypothetical protein